MLYAIVLIAVLLLALLVLAPAGVERCLNRVGRRGPYSTSERARELHRRLTVVDFHSDALLWGRNLLKRSARGHVDVPRLVEGNVAVQAFTIVTRTPLGLNINKTHAGAPDLCTVMSILQRRRPAAWFSLMARALDQAARLRETASRSDGALRIIETRQDLRRYLEERVSQPRITAGFLGVEGLHCLEGRLENVEVLYNAGVRMASPTHFFDNDVAGSAHGVQKYGLTDFGRQVVGRLEDLGILIDLAHASPKAIDDVLAVARRPVVVSHTGVKGTHDTARNLADEHVKAIAEGGGVIGIGFWSWATGGDDAASIVRAMRYTSDLVGVGHVALGSDFDGCTKPPFDSTGLVVLTEALLENGFSEEGVESIMGANAVRLLSEVLPGDRASAAAPTGGVGS